ncbi:putative Histidine kinase [Desulfamplus magnetovallimortis]|uniref:histidine kinase n=1 Tax=Desulfamplus magnetovallimortis TaxID=1246637 RepID=A0A1W1H7Y5_9BACT|nr:cache domain-containing protein [Desulfamplus magnetovallimortis]SLM28546.1 putative Histidine kinase [Desulfamplus magnetovallimortis]
MKAHNNSGLSPLLFFPGKEPSLQKTLTLSLLIIATLPIIVTGFISLEIMSQKMERDILDKNHAIATSIAGEVSRSLKEPLAILQHAQEMIDNEGFIPNGQKNRYLASICRTYPFFSSIRILDTKGIVRHIAPYNEDYAGIDLSSQPFFKTVSKGKKPTWSSPYIAVQTGQPTISLSYPLEKGVIVAHLTLSYLKNISDRIRIGGTGYAAMVDRNGTVIAHPETVNIAEQQNLKHLPVVALGLEGKRGTLRYTVNSVEWMGSVDIVPVTGWLVCVFQPAKEALSPLMQIRNIIFAGTATAILLAVIAALVIARNAMIPLTMLLESTVKIARGDYNHSIETESYREINTLAKNFNIMTEAVKSREKALKKDMEERRRLEEQLRQAHKMEAIGTLAGGIAHDFNNILGAVLGYAEMARFEVEGQETATYQIEQIVKAGNRARDLVKHILTFSRKGPQKRAPLEISILIKEALQLLRATIPANIEIRKSISTENTTILADATQLHQVIMNLCTNAAQSMEANEKGGMLHVELKTIDTGMKTEHHEFLLESTNPKTDNHEILPENRDIKIYNHDFVPEKVLPPELHSKPGIYVKLSISDNGAGIQPEHLEKIFDPYFTTKAVGKGSGMGLSVVMGIVKNHEGIITVESIPGKGSKFNLFFPGIPTEINRQIETVKPIEGGNEHILVVDDQEDMAETIQLLLERIGYQVTSTTSSIDALAMFRAKPSIFDLVITDQTMPDLTGGQLAREMLKIRHDLPIILCTGYSLRIDEERALAMGIGAFVMKPVDIKELDATIRKLLSE